MDQRRTPRRRIAGEHSGAQTSRLLCLPSELLQHILSELTATSLAHSCLVSSHLASAASERELWRKHCKALWRKLPTSVAPSRQWFGARVRLFRGVVLCCTRMDAASRNSACTAVEAMGGKMSLELEIVPRVRVTHLLCDGTMTPKALAAWERTRVVSPAWFWHSVRDGRLLNAAEYAVRALHGVVVCLSGFDATSRHETATAFMALGATVETNYNALVTHLCVGPGIAQALRLGLGDPMAATTSAKVAVARQTRVPIIDAWQWLTRMHNRNGRPVDPFASGCCV